MTLHGGAPTNMTISFYTQEALMRTSQVMPHRWLAAAVDLEREAKLCNEQAATLRKRYEEWAAGAEEHQPGEQEEQRKEGGA